MIFYYRLLNNIFFNNYKMELGNNRLVLKNKKKVLFSDIFYSI